MTVEQLLVRTAKKSPCRYKVSAVAFSKKGNILGQAYCKHNLPKDGGGVHAERELMSRYGNNIHSILIMRINKQGDILPIKPCKVCQKIADRKGIVIKSVER